MECELVWRGFHWTIDLKIPWKLNVSCEIFEFPAKFKIVSMPLNQSNFWRIRLATQKFFWLNDIQKWLGAGITVRGFLSESLKIQKCFIQNIVGGLAARDSLFTCVTPEFCIEIVVSINSTKFSIAPLTF